MFHQVQWTLFQSGLRGVHLGVVWLYVVLDCLKFVLIRILTLVTSFLETCYQKSEKKLYIILSLLFITGDVNPYQAEAKSAEFFSCGFLQHTSIFVAESLVDEVMESIFLCLIYTYTVKFQMSPPHPKPLQKYTPPEISPPKKPFEQI